MRTFARSRGATARHLLLVAVVLAGCGGGGGSSNGGSSGSGGVMWPDRGGGSSMSLPPSVVTGRVVFQSSTGEACCVAVDPTLLSPDPNSGQALLVLDNLPIGPATVTVAGFSTDFAPIAPGIVMTCQTVNATGAAPCDPTRAASPAFESAPLAVNILPGAQVNLGAIDVSALPFVYAFSPAQDEAVPLPVQFAFTVVDAVTGIAADSVKLEVTVNVEDGDPPMFHPLTKRIPLQLSACTDGGELPCSADGDLELAGFKATGVALNLPEGPAEARITAQNLAAPARDLDFSYVFNVLPEPTETATPLPTGTAVVGSAPADSGAAPAPGQMPSGGGAVPGSLPGSPATPVPPAIAPSPTPTITPNGSTAGSE